MILKLKKKNENLKILKITEYHDIFYDIISYSQ